MDRTYSYQMLIKWVSFLSFYFKVFFLLRVTVRGRQLNCFGTNIYELSVLEFHKST